jgi:hypothetical protein
MRDMTYMTDMGDRPQPLPGELRAALHPWHKTPLHKT